jgi:arabinofuranosyltransferase
MVRASRRRWSSSWSSSWIWGAPLLGLLIAAYYEWHAQQVVPAGFPLDDAWIHAQFARNLATGHGFSYTGDRWVSGSTAPIWTIVLALGYLLLPNIVIVAKVLGLLFQAGTAVVAARFGMWLTESKLVGFAAGMLAAVAPIMVWGAMSGMEVPMAAFLVLLGIDRHLRAPSGTGAVCGAFWLALACLARPECLIILALALADLAVHWLRHRDVSKPRPRIVWAVAAVAIVLVPWVAFNYATVGKPLPTTFYAKSGSGIVRALEQRDWAMAQRDAMVFGPQALTNFVAILRDQLGLAAWFIPLALVWGILIERSRRQAMLFLLLVLVVMPFAMGLTAPQRLKLSNERYVPQLIVLGAVLVAVGTAPIVRLLQRPTPQLPHVVRYGIAAAIPVLLALSATQHIEEGVFYFTRSVKNIQELHVALGKWIDQHLPPDAVVATNDVGAIAYFGHRPILDIEGLVSPEALAYRGPGRGLQVAEKFHPDYLAIFPHWYPEIAAQPDRFRLVYRASIPDNYIAAGGEFLVLQSPWARVPLLKAATVAGTMSGKSGVKMRVSMIEEMVTPTSTIAGTTQSARWMKSG